LRIAAPALKVEGGVDVGGAVFALRIMSLSSQTGCGEPVGESTPLDGPFELLPVGWSLPEEGSVMHISPVFASLPGSGCTAEPPSSDAPRPPGSDPAPRGTSILVIDDEPLICFTTRQLLELSGYDVLTATNGPDAVELFGRDPARVAAVLLDLSMPGTSADEILTALKHRRDDIRVILMSGYDQQEIEARVRDAAVAAFLPKPFTMDQLNETLTRVLGA
jgi:CheY-like chemotaxis protein